MTVSDNPFTALEEQVEEADRSIKAAVAQNDADLEAMLDDARKKAEDRAAQLSAASTKTPGQTDSQWDKVKSDWDEHIRRVRANVDSKKGAHDADVAESDAEWAESDAVDALSFASSAIDEARYAVLEAVWARRKANVLTAAK